MEEIRLNKYLSEAGVCSRREADRLIAAGEVLVDGKVADMGMKVTDRMTVVCQGRRVGRREEPVLLAVNKPVGVVCTTSKEEPDNIVDYVGFPVRLFPVGRLDKDSEGLILMTNQGEWSDRILRSRNGHEKEYLVTVNKPVTLEFLEQMRKGVRIRDDRPGAHHLDAVTKPCTVEKVAYNRFRIILTQGLNRQIRRMCEALNYRVTELRRVRVLNIQLGSQKLGTWRRIEGQELEDLLALLDTEG